MKFFRFEDPLFLILFFIIPYIVWKRKEQITISYSSLEILQNIRAIKVGFLSTIPLILRLFAISLFIIALARPQEGYKRTEILSMGVDIMMALDTSGSMQALDLLKMKKEIRVLPWSKMWFPNLLKIEPMTEWVWWYLVLKPTLNVRLH